MFPIEIKKTASPGRTAIKNFKALNPILEPKKFSTFIDLKTDIGEGSVICMARDILPIDGKNWTVPVWLI